jgi:hypothetical protein
MFQLVALSLGLDRTYFDAFAADPDGEYTAALLEGIFNHVDVI